MTGVLGILLGPALAAQQGIPLAPPLHTRLIALVVVEVVLITTAVLLYVRWAQLKGQPLDEWWAGRVAAGFSPRTRALMEESERERQAAEDAATAGAAAPPHAAPPDAAPPQPPPQT
jgi:hypothetical protein